MNSRPFALKSTMPSHPTSREGEKAASSCGGSESTRDQETGLILDQILTHSLGRPVRIIHMSRQASPYATLAPAFVVFVQLETGERFSVFLKQHGDEGKDHPDKQRRDREVRVYQDLLNEDSLPAVRYYGSRWNGSIARTEIYLEHVDGWDLRYHDLEYWFLAARKLGELHAHFAADTHRLLAADYLLRMDENYYNSWAERALTAVSRGNSQGARRLETVVRDFRKIAAFLAGQPVTLVHNDLSPKNVLTDRSVSPPRICIVDWEMAGVGCGLLDLVHLKYGLEPADDRNMLDLYCEQLRGTGLLPGDSRELNRLVASCELHKCMFRLARSQAWGATSDRVLNWISEAQRLTERVRLE